LLAAGVLGVYSAAIALAPNAWISLALAAPLVLLPLGWWLLTEPRRWIALFFATSLLLPPLPIRLGDSGPHIALAVAVFGVFLGFTRLSEWRFRADLLTASLVLYFGVLLASTSVAALYSGPAIAAATLARVVLFGISLYVFFYTAYGPAAPPWRMAGLFWMAVASAAFGCVDFYFQLPAPAGFGPQFVWLSSGVYRRAQGVFYEAGMLGNFCAFFLTMIAAALLGPGRARPVSKRALVAGGIVFSAALIFSFSRASLVNLAVAGSVLIFLYGKRLRWRKVAAVGAIIAAAAGIAAFALPTFTELYWGRLSGTLQFLFSTPETVLSGRVDNWRILGRFLLDHPLPALIGVGYKTLPYSDVTGHPLIVDNMYLSMLGETGVAGLLALLLFNGAILRAAYRAARHPDLRTSFLGAWIFSFWMGQLFQMFSSDVLTYWRVLPVYFWVLALAVRGCDEHPVS
jgi:O-antigen ligase